MSKFNKEKYIQPALKVEEPIVKPHESEFVFWSKKSIRAVILAGIIAKIGDGPLARIEAKKISEDIIDGKD
jgi:hypothetical protein